MALHSRVTRPGVQLAFLLCVSCLLYSLALGVIFVRGHREWNSLAIQMRIKVKEKKAQCVSQGPVRGQMAFSGRTELYKDEEG